MTALLKGFQAVLLHVSLPHRAQSEAYHPQLGDMLLSQYIDPGF